MAGRHLLDAHKKNFESESRDIRWGNAIICWCDRREGWALPGGGFTRIEAYATKTAKSIADYLATSHIDFKRIAA